VPEFAYAHDGVSTACVFRAAFTAASSVTSGLLRRQLKACCMKRFRERSYESSPEVSSLPAADAYEDRAATSGYRKFFDATPLT
jgi:hypothetical protein